MKKSFVLIFLSLLLTSCMNAVELNVSLRKVVNSAIKKSGAIVQNFGEQGSLSLAYSDLKEDVRGNFKPQSSYCFSDLSCVYHTRVKLSGAADEFDYLIKVNPQFQIDTSFGVNGYLLLPSVDTRMSNPLFDFIYLLGISTSDNKIYVGFGNGIARLLPNGKIDTTFGSRGIFAMDRSVYNYFPSKIIESNLDELLILTAIAPGGGSLSTGSFGSALISVSKTGAFKAIQDFNNTNLVVYRTYNNSFLIPSDIGEMLVIDNGSVNDVYYAYMVNSNLNVTKTNLETTAVGGFNFNAYNTTGSDYRVKKLFEVGSEIYVFLSTPTSETSASKLVVFDKTTGAINPAKSKSFTNGPQMLVLDDVLKSSSGFVLTLKHCLVVQFSNDCGRSNRFAAQMDMNGNIMSLVSVATSTGAEIDFIGQAKTLLQKRNNDFYALNFSPQFIGSLGEAYTKLSIKKFDELISADNTFGSAGEMIVPLAYTIKLSFVNLADKILLDDDINSYYLVNYSVGLKKVHKIVKLDKNINAVSAFANGGTIDLSSFFEVNTIELDEANKLLYVVYTFDNAGIREIYIRRYNMLTGVLDTGFGTAGELFVYSEASAGGGYASLYNKQVVKPMTVLDPRSYILKDGFILTVQRPQDPNIFRVYKFNFNTGLLISKVLTGTNFPESLNYTLQEISKISITKSNSIFVTARLSAGNGFVFHGQILKLSSADLSVDSTFGTNGLMFVDGGTAATNGAITEVISKEVYKVTDDYIYVGAQSLLLEAGGAGYTKYQITPGFLRMSYAGVFDTAFENSVKQQVDSYRTQFNGGKTNFAIAQSAPISKSDKYMSFLIFGVFANDMDEYLALASDTAALYAYIYIGTIKFEYGEHETIKNVIFKVFPFLTFMNGEVNDESFVLEEMYSFDKGEYTYKIAVSSFDTEGQPIFKLFKIYN